MTISESVPSAENGTANSPTGNVPAKETTTSAGSASLLSRVDSKRRIEDEIQHGEASGWVTGYHVRHVLHNKSWSELSYWAEENDWTRHVPMMESLGDLCRFVVSVLKLDDMRKKHMFECWPEAFPDEIKLNMHGEPSWPKRSSGR